MMSMIISIEPKEGAGFVPQITNSGTVIVIIKNLERISGAVNNLMHIS